MRPSVVPKSENAGQGASWASSNLALRIVSAIVLAPLALFVTWYGDWPFALFWCVAAVAILWEWTRLVAGPRHELMLISCGSAITVAALVEWRARPITAIMLIGLGALAAAIFAPRDKNLWITAGVGYAGTLLLAPLLLRADPQYGLFVILLLFGTVWATDICAYFAGRLIGGPKLAPSISPKKTWSGAIAGTLGGILVALLMGRFASTFVGGEAKPFGYVAIAMIGFLLSVLAQFGDLLESWIKRSFGAKDASGLIPGHGGVMDRLDGFWAAALGGCILGLVRGGFEYPARGLLVW